VHFFWSIYSGTYNCEHENTHIAVKINSLYFKNDINKINSTQFTGEGGEEGNITGSFLAKRLRPWNPGTKLTHR